MAIAAPLGSVALKSDAKAEVENRGITAQDIIAITDGVMRSGFFSQRQGGLRVLATAGAVSTQPGKAKVVNDFSREEPSPNLKPAEGTLGSMGPKSMGGGKYLLLPSYVFRFGADFAWKHEDDEYYAIKQLLRCCCVGSYRTTYHTILGSAGKI